MKINLTKIALFLLLVFGQVACTINFPGNSNRHSNSNTSIQKTANKSALLRSAVLAFFQNDYVATERYIANIKDVNAKIFDNETTLLHAATLYAADKAVATLLANGADVDVKMEGNITPLLFAAMMKANRVVALLLSYGADVNHQTDTEGITPLFMAVYKDHDTSEILDFKDLRAEGIFINQDKILTRLSTAEKVVALLLAYGADVNLKSAGNITALHVATESNDDKVVSLLIAHGADVNAKTDDGWTPLSVAIEKKAWKIEKVLRAHGAK